MRRILLTVAASALSALASTAFAADFGISADKLLIIDKTLANGKAKVVFVSHDANITKGPSTDPADIEATLQIYFKDNPANDSLFRLPSPWFKNKPTVAKYLNTSAPLGGGVKIGMVKPGKLAKDVARSLGDLRQINVLSPNVGDLSLIVVLTITDASDGSTTRLCTKFSAIVQKSIVGGVGRKLLAIDGQPVACTGGTTILMQPGLTDGFFSMPWPNDTRRNGDGWEAIPPEQLRPPWEARRRLGAMWERIWRQPAEVAAAPRPADAADGDVHAATPGLGGPG